ncbi:hypothetical protein M5689_016132 [Euphorbia peplus]|nr:hypothetical protein M5689_016132 [Euphorbia peplus]
MFICGSFAGTVIEVGDTAGWSRPSFNYEKWAAQKIFTSEDLLVFNSYTKQLPYVKEVTVRNFITCNGTNPISSDKKLTVVISLWREGFRYFTSAYPGQCEAGMKFHFFVRRA